MTRTLLIAVVIAVGVSPASAWNEKGHMVAARLAWNALTPAERSWVNAVLARHPHYVEFLAAGRQENVPQEEWVFMRAAVWSDWVRSNHADEYNKPTWHYVNLPIAPAGSRVDAAARPPLPPNVITQIKASTILAKGGNSEDRAVHLCWLFHLIGDIHQPLHCAALFSERFPTGDQGGNLAFYRIRGNKVRLHFLWDGLLGNDISLASIGSTTREIEQLRESMPDEFRNEWTKHRTPEEWAEEGAQAAKQFVYCNGAIEPAPDAMPLDHVPEVGEEYAREAGAVARQRVAAAGLRLAEKIRELHRSE